MSKFKYRNITILVVTSCILVGCSNGNQNNNYENKPIIPSETVEKTNTDNTQINAETEITTEMNTEVEETTNEEKITDEEVIEYINKVGDEINNCTDGITESAADGFIKVVDFLFYNGEIGGRTFDSLKEETKVKVLEIYNSVSEYLDEKLPVWQQSLGEKYEAAKTYWDENKEILFDALESGKQKVKDWYEEFRKKHQN